MGRPLEWLADAPPVRAGLTLIVLVVASTLVVGAIIIGVTLLAREVLP